MSIVSVESANLKKIIMPFINILQLRSSVGFYGAENVIIEIAKSVSSSPYKLIIGILENSRNPHIELAAVAQKHNFPSQIFQCAGRFSQNTTKTLRQFLLKHDIAILHTHDYKADFYASLATFNSNIKRVATIHPWLGVDHQITAKFYAALDKQILRSFHRLIAISPEMYGQLVQYGLPTSKLVTIENGIDLCRFNSKLNKNEARKQFGLPCGTTVIGAVGRLSEEKGHALLLRTAQLLVADFPDLLFMLVGDGPLREKLAHQVEAMGLQKHVIFTGVRRDIPQVLSAMDIFVLPSFTEGLPMTLLEAMAARKPIVASAVGSIPRLIRNQENGLTIRPHDVHDLCEALTYLIRQPADASRFASQAQADVESFSAAEMGKKYIKLYDELLQSESSAAKN
ncbi:MAG: D-inositol-3-phosphate glycosyltransferase [bacterium]|nr:D-inositol-3-phosphate glycosyltransferase [bacterium]